MSKIPRNYVAEILSTGKTNRQLAKELHTTVKRINAYQTGMYKPPAKQYETIRNIARRTTYQKLRQAGISPKEAKRFQRVPDVKPLANDFENWLDKWARIFQKKWNGKHKDPNDEKYLTLDEVKDRLKTGIRRGKKRSEIENY